jgi:hypothetical protein
LIENYLTSEIFGCARSWNKNQQEFSPGLEDNRAQDRAKSWIVTVQDVASRYEGLLPEEGLHATSRSQMPPRLRGT